MENIERILVVDDEEPIRDLLEFNLMKDGYEVITCDNGIDAEKIAKKEKPSLMLLDLMLPGKDGYEVCKSLRNNAETKHIPVIMLTAKGEEFDKILGLELGADDYITKPFSVRELMARIKAVLRRTKVVKEKHNMKFGEITIDFEKHEVMKGDTRIDLTLKEFELLEMLCKNQGKVLTREILLDKIWGYDYIGETRTVDVHIRHLRKKLEKNDKAPEFIQTVRGIGYRLDVGE